MGNIERLIQGLCSDIPPDAGNARSRRKSSITRIGRRRLLQGSGAVIAASRLATPGLAAGDRQLVLRFMPQVDLVTLDRHFSMINVKPSLAGWYSTSSTARTPSSRPNRRWSRGTS